MGGVRQTVEQPPLPYSLAEGFSKNPVRCCPLRVLSLVAFLFSTSGFRSPQWGKPLSATSNSASASASTSADAVNGYGEIHSAGKVGIPIGHVEIPL